MLKDMLQQQEQVMVTVLFFYVHIFVRVAQINKINWPINREKFLVIKNFNR